VFPRSQRITSLEFDDILKRGKTSVSPLFSLCYLPANKSYFAVVASKKVSKKAVVRNRNKRHTRSILRKIEQELSRSGYFILFIKRDLSTIEHVVLEEALRKLVL
jgi:ribonuclease P protein component